MTMLLEFLERHRGRHLFRSRHLKRHPVRVHCKPFSCHLEDRWCEHALEYTVFKEGIRPCMKSIRRGTYKTNICAEI